jgi:hypothetical protein
MKLPRLIEKLRERELTIYSSKVFLLSPIGGEGIRVRGNLS